MSFSVKDIKEIEVLGHRNVDMSKKAIPSKMIEACVNTLNSDHMTPRNKALYYFPMKQLNTLSTLKEWNDVETK